MGQVRLFHSHENRNQYYLEILTMDPCLFASIIFFAVTCIMLIGANKFTLNASSRSSFGVFRASTKRLSGIYI